MPRRIIAKIRPTLNAKLLAIYVPLICFSMVLLFLFFDSRELKTQRERLIENLNQFTATLSVPITSLLWDFDVSTMNNMISVLYAGADGTDIESIMVFDEKGYAVASIGDYKALPGSPDLRARKPLVYASSNVTKFLGTLVVTYHLERLMEGRRKRLGSNVAAILTLVIMLTVVTLVATRLVIGRPLSRLRGSIDRMREENIYTAVRWKSNDEVGDLVRSFNDMQRLKAAAEKKLLRYQNDLEKIIDDRTRELKFQQFALDQHAIVSIADVKGNIFYANDKFCKVCGFSREELIGQNLRIVKSGEHPPELYAEMWRTISNGKVWRGEVRNKKKDGGFYWANATIVPFMDEQGSPFRYISISTDITQRKAAEESAKSANQAKSEFLSNMSHELRTPLNAILGFSQLLELNKKEPLSDRQQDQVNHIKKSGEHLLELINDILDLAKIEAGKLPLSIESIEPRNLLDECLLLTQTMAAKRGITIEDRTGDNLRAVSADYLRTKQAILNLLSNAVKYNREKGRVRISAEQQSGRLRINVTDTGIGIPERMQSEMFQPFSRLGIEGVEMEGTGIGLVLTRKLVEGMGGNIDFKSTHGEGSTFWIELPLAEAQGEAGGRQTGVDLNIGNDQRLLLYVDDNPANLSLMEDLIKEIPNLTLISADNAKLGLKLAKSRKPDIIILDINLPGMDGDEAVKHLQGDPSLKKIPVLALSANTTPGAIKRGLKAGVREYLAKPIDFAKLTAAIKDALKEQA